MPDTYTDSAFRDSVTEEILDTVHIQTISQSFQFYLTTPLHKKMIERFNHKITNEIQHAITSAVVRHFTHLKAHTIQEASIDKKFSMAQAEMKITLREYLGSMPPNPTTIKIDPQMFPSLTLSKLDSKYVDKIIVTEVTIVGPSQMQVYLDKVETEESIFDYKLYDQKKDGDIIEKIYNDTQYLLVEELEGGKDPRKLTVKLYGDLVGKFDVGDRVKITGRFETIPSDDDDQDVFINVIHMEKLQKLKEFKLTTEELSTIKQITEVDPEGYLNDLTKSFAPHIYGNHIPKLGILLTSMISPRASTRSNMLLLLVGSPGVGKSEMLKATLNIHENVAYVDAPNVSARGLLYGQEEFNKTKILRAGVLVRYNLALIDEFDKMGKGQRVELNTAVEQQLASYHKTPFDKDTEINVGIIAGANPSGGIWKEDRSITENLKNLESTVLDRYLIIKVSKPENNNAKYDTMFDALDEHTPDTPYSYDQLRGLINHCKNITPSFTPEAKQMVKDFLNSFVAIEQSSRADLVIETRKELDLIRVIKKMTQLLLRDTIDEQCVRLGVNFYKECMSSIGMATDAPTAQKLLQVEGSQEDIFWSLYRTMLNGKDDVSETDLKQEMQKSERWTTIEGIDTFLKHMLKEKVYNPRVGYVKKI